MTHVFTNPFFQTLWSGKDPFRCAFELSGESFRKVKSRHTFRVVLEGKGYFVKLHRGCGWAEIFKNLLQGKMAVLGAGQEYRALRHLEGIGVRSMTPAAFGETGWNPADITSFLITEELTETLSLEELAAELHNQIPPQLKYRLIAELADMAGRMHRSGLNHRDCYICHFLLKKKTRNEEKPVLHVIDLHRAQIRSCVPFRYLVKDLGGLLFSAMDLNLTKRDLLRFRRAYEGISLRESLQKNDSLFRAAGVCAEKLYRRIHGKAPQTGVDQSL